MVCHIVTELHILAYDGESVITRGDILANIDVIDRRRGRNRGARGDSWSFGLGIHIQEVLHLADVDCTILNWLDAEAIHNLEDLAAMDFISDWGVTWVTSKVIIDTLNV